MFFFNFFFLYGSSARMQLWKNESNKAHWNTWILVNIKQSVRDTTSWSVIERNVSPSIQISRLLANEIFSAPLIPWRFGFMASRLDDLTGYIDCMYAKNRGALTLLQSNPLSSTVSRNRIELLDFRTLTIFNSSFGGTENPWWKYSGRTLSWMKSEIQNANNTLRVKGIRLCVYIIFLF